MILAATYDELEERIVVLASQEELNSIRPDLDGNQIMEILELPAGPMVGKAYKYMLDVRLDEGPMSYDQAVDHLKTWWNSQSD
jgi:poly(A) polymerase